MTKKDILKRIEELFYEKSFKEVSMQNIANEIGMKKASLYHHFSSKDILIKDVLDESFLCYLNFIKDIITQWKDDNFQDLLQSFLDFWENQKNIFSIINQNWYVENETILAHIREHQKVIFDTIDEIMHKKANFTSEKTFLFLTLINQIGRKNNIYNACEIDKNRIWMEIENLFFKN